MRDQVQKAGVRVIASELDRRAKPIEQALRDLQARIVAIEQRESDPEVARQLRQIVGTMSAAQDRLGGRVDELGSRMAAREAAHEQLDDALRSLRLDVSAMQSQMAQALALLEQLASRS
jgi:chromosome segregation ATPase